MATGTASPRGGGGRVPRGYGGPGLLGLGPGQSFEDRGLIGLVQANSNDGSVLVPLHLDGGEKAGVVTEGLEAFLVKGPRAGLVVG
jgi:hypothetical protein